jgi:hypothetical protein
MVIKNNHGTDPKLIKARRQLFRKELLKKLLMNGNRV